MTVTTTTTTTTTSKVPALWVGSLHYPATQPPQAARGERWEARCMYLRHKRTKTPWSGSMTMQHRRHQRSMMDRHDRQTYKLSMPYSKMTTYCDDYYSDYDSYDYYC